jgi:hypothetical protein
MEKYSNGRMSVMIKLLGNLRVFITFYLNPIKELVGYNEKFQLQKVVVEVIWRSCWRFFLCTNFVGILLSSNILYFVCSP